ncbi:hypothetical protein GCM10007424_01020 [Flavobacterium suaedae]|uniref:DUF1697 domain-containing protein n=1 Tax=Flavobacterium suaedae TaxID=1767027 RepID=A0ABQ1JBU4_9FLAO|nr:DUF1697 domain-containing protein [Flavobacterium suaedae]GGB64917.1 hypothetical protein GCM10007424_01020 [Flavobacterium suaedae]
MNVYAVLFRGINVSGKNVIKMEALRNLLTEAGYESVKTYIQSGNVVFKSKEEDKATLAKNIERLIKEHYNYDIIVFVYNKADIAKVLQNSPYATADYKEEGVKKLYLTFLSEIPAKENIEKLHQAPIGNDEITLTDDIVYFKLATKASESKLSNNLIESKLKVKATTRNWNTTIKLFSMLEAL